ncbi:hypothetical protein GJAV_G00104440 [Gymnothorax javanicus]|nr:hypothetical protein GJAV_G00104440 [Gymnothorax javanicus]
MSDPTENQPGNSGCQGKGKAPKRKKFSWSEQQTLNFIKLRTDHEAQFMGHRHSAEAGFETSSCQRRALGQRGKSQLGLGLTLRQCTEPSGRDTPPDPSIS